jgi:hypothetical protein
MCSVYPRIVGYMLCLSAGVLVLRHCLRYLLYSARACCGLQQHTQSPQASGFMMCLSAGVLVSLASILRSKYYWYKSTCLTSTKVQILEELLRARVWCCISA